eukprot:scaffold2114_cov309-Prasinococcus_capsulatus_cf.AAC.2
MWRDAATRATGAHTHVLDGLLPPRRDLELQLVLEGLVLELLLRAQPRLLRLAPRGGLHLLPPAALLLGLPGRGLPLRALPRLARKALRLAPPLRLALLLHLALGVHQTHQQPRVLHVQRRRRRVVVVLARARARARAHVRVRVRVRGRGRGRDVLRWPEGRAAVSALLFPRALFLQVLLQHLQLPVRLPLLHVPPHRGHLPHLQQVALTGQPQLQNKGHQEGMSRPERGGTGPCRHAATDWTAHQRRSIRSQCARERC